MLVHQLCTSLIYYIRVLIVNRVHFIINRFYSNDFFIVLRVKRIKHNLMVSNRVLNSITNTPF